MVPNNLMSAFSPRGWYHPKSAKKNPSWGESPYLGSTTPAFFLLLFGKYPKKKASGVGILPSFKAQALERILLLGINFNFFAWIRVFALGSSQGQNSADSM